MSDTVLGEAREAKHTPSAFAGMLSPIAADEEVEAPIVAAPTEAPAVKEAPKEPAAPTTERKAKAAKPAAAVRPPATAPVAASGDGGEGKDLANQAVQISLPVSLEEKLEAYKKTSGLSHPFILFEAIEETIDQLPTLVKERTVQVSTQTKTLFNRPSSVAKRQVDTEPRKTFIIRITQENKGILDQLWQDVGAPNRNVMIVAAYEAFLTTKAKAKK